MSEVHDECVFVIAGVVGQGDGGRRMGTARMAPALVQAHGACTTRLSTAA
jgi:hypothetical protein